MKTETKEHILLIVMMFAFIVAVMFASSCKRFKFWNVEISEDPNQITVNIDKDI